MTTIDDEFIRAAQDPETMRLHMGELTRGELLVAQAAVRYALARAKADKPYERAVIEQAMVTECVSVSGRDPSDVLRDIIQWHVSVSYKAEKVEVTDAMVDAAIAGYGKQQKGLGIPSQRSRVRTALNAALIAASEK